MRDSKTKRAEAILLVEAERDYRLLFDNMIAGIAVHRMIYDSAGNPIDYRFISVNPAFEQLTGLSGSTLIGRTVMEVMPGTERYWIETYAEVARTGKPTAFRNFSKELNKHFDTWVFSPAKDEFAVVFTDITEKVRTEEKLASSEERFRVLFETMAQGVVFQNDEGKIELANPAAERILGLSLDQLQGRTSLDPRWKTIHEDGTEFPGSEHPVVKAFETGRPIFGTNMAVYDPKTERHRWIKVDAIPLFREKAEKPYRVYAMFTDIGERNKIEATQAFLAKRGWDASGEDFFQALARFLSTILEADYVCIDRLEGDGLSARTVAVYFDGRFKDNVSYTLRDTPCGDVVGKSICCFPRSVRDLFPNDVFLQEMAAESYAGTPLWSGDGKPIGLIAVIARKPLDNAQLAEMVLDLVSIRAAGELERRVTADTLRSLVKQKETLLRELQHRVKNNLNVVTSLLELETEELVDEKAKEIFIASRNRIQSMSTIYEKLYLSEDLETVELGGYIRDLASSIFAAYDIAQGRVRITVDADKINLETRRVVPLGLILNELISNALKYAFPSDKRGELHISLNLTGKRISLTVSDNGIGLPSGFDPMSAESLGLTLIRMLAEEIQATLAFKNESGVAVSLSFDL